MSKMVRLDLAVIHREAALQPRETMASVIIAEYGSLYAEGQDLAPIVVFQDGMDYWLADGFHRVEAARKAGLMALPAEVHQGSKRDALFYSCGANKHGKTRTNEDKRRQVRRLLEDAEWQAMSNYEMARHCGVSHEFVRQLKRSLPTVGSEDAAVTYRTKHGTLTTMNTTHIGKNGHSAPAPTADDIDRATIEATYAQPLDRSPGQALRLVSSAPPVPKGQTPPTFNRTNEQVDWATWTWNPVTGCLHTCVYCYARDIANRYYPERFAPTFRPERLKAPHYTKVPAEADTQIGERNVFVCSMADLFGKWVEQAWIDAVMDEVRAAPQWNFLFLTKFPQRLETIAWPQNAWVGTTVDEQYRVSIAEKAFRNVDAPVKWLSCEPLRQRLTFTSLTMFDWVVIGGQSKSTQAPAFQPPWEWVEHLWQQARASGCMVYWKPNLLTRPQEYPGHKETSHANGIPPLP